MMAQFYRMLSVHVLHRDVHRLVINVSRKTSVQYGLSMSVRAMTYMNAWQIYKYGGPEELKLSPKVKMRNINSASDVLIEIHAASVNPIDIAMLGGYGSATMSALEKLTCSENSLSDLPNQLRNMVKIPFNPGRDFPITLGRDFSGVVKDIGQNAARHYKPGDQVWGVANPLKSHHGTHAEYTVVSTSDLSSKPISIAHTEAASMPYVICTTWAALTVFGNISKTNANGKRALVLGGSGGIGTLAIQLLKCWGAEVTTTCSTDAIQNVLSVGADVAIDYKTHDVLSELKLIEGFDLILDCVKKDSKDLDDLMGLLKSNLNAHYVTLNSPLLRNNDSLGFPFGFAKSFIDFGPNVLKYAKEGKHYRWGFYMPNEEALKSVADLVDEGKVVPVVEKVYEFDEVPSAFEKVAAGHNRGKTVINVKGLN